MKRYLLFCFFIILSATNCGRQSQSYHSQKKSDKPFDAPIKIYFETGDYKINQHSSEIEFVANYLKQNRNEKILIEGHADERGSNYFNLKLGDYRSRSVYQALLERGVNSDQVLLISYGELKPVSQSSSHFNLNRRVEIKKTT